MPNPTEYPRCRSCRWWDEASGERPNWGGCGHDKVQYDERNDGGVYFCDYESYSAALETHADFGCILHEERGDE